MKGSQESQRIQSAFGDANCHNRVSRWIVPPTGFVKYGADPRAFRSAHGAHRRERCERQVETDVESTPRIAENVAYRATRPARGYSS